MENSIKAVGRIMDSRHIELDEPLTCFQGRVEITLSLQKATVLNRPDVFELISGFPAGTRSKEDIVRELDAERSSWDSPV